MKYSKVLMIIALAGVMVAATAFGAAVATFTGGYVAPQGNPNGSVNFTVHTGATGAVGGAGDYFGKTNWAWGEAIQFTFNANGSITAATDSLIGSTYSGTYDANKAGGGDDVMAGFINNSGSSVPGITLTGGSAALGGIFNFDGDDGFGPLGANGAPLITVAGVKTVTYTDDTGTLFFNGGLANGASSWFAFETIPSGFTPIPSGVPLPPSVLLFGSGLVGLAGWRRFKS